MLLRSGICQQRLDTEDCSLDPLDDLANVFQHGLNPRPDLLIGVLQIRHVEAFGQFEVGEPFAITRGLGTFDGFYGV